MRIGIYSKIFKEEYHSTLCNLIETLNSVNAHVWMHHAPKEEMKKNKNLPLPIINNEINDNHFPSKLDYMISVGGDGTFLEAITTLKLKKIPLIGINTGRLGFLADISPESITESIHKLEKGDFHVEQRSMLKADILPKQDIELPYALNELTIHKRETSSMITIHTYIDDSFLASYWADGLIISTSTGSTAYSLSAGGPIVAPNTEVFIITPIAPHNLTVRPLVIPNNHKISLKVESRDKNFLLSLDSRSFTIEEPFEVIVKKAKDCAQVLKFEEFYFYNTIRNKLLWSIDKRN